jgi:hypothetical protein
MKGIRVGLVAVFALALIVPAAAGAKQRPVSGTWQNPEALNVSSLDPISGAYRGTGTSNWQGTWAGTTTFSTQGVTNVLTGDTRGTVDETFTGATPNGKQGTLHFLEEFTVAPFTGDFHLVAHLQSGTGAFKRSRGGTVTFVGHTDSLTGIGSGTYAGTWRLPKKKRR